MDDTQHELIALSDSDKTMAREDDDIRGYEVKDIEGEDLGMVENLLIDNNESKVRFLVIASGGFLGLGEQKSFLPVDAITEITSGEVRIDQIRERLRDAPAYDPNLVKDRDYSEGVFGYYGYTPYWAPGYRYPRFPYYM